MWVFHIKDRRLEKVNEIPFKDEGELQTIIDGNLKDVFGLVFIKAQYFLDDLRIDTVAFDPNNKSFVIIEYKNDANFSVVDQGYTYLNLLIDKKADFILLYREQTGEDLKKDDVDWTGTRVLFVSPKFTKYSVRAINTDLPIDLIEVHRYENNLIVLNKVQTKRGGGSAAAEFFPKSSVIQKVRKEIKLYDEEYHINQTTTKIKDIYIELKKRIMSLDDTIEIRPRKKYIGFIAATNFVDVHFEKRKLKVWLNLKKGELNDPQHLSRDVSNIGHWGNGDYEIDIDNISDLDYLMTLIQQAYQKNSS